MQEVHRFRRFSGFDDQPALLASGWACPTSSGAPTPGRPRGRGGRAASRATWSSSRLPILDSGNQALPNQPGLEPRALLHVDVEVGDQRVRIYDTHLQYTARRHPHRAGPCHP